MRNFLAGLCLLAVPIASMGEPEVVRGDDKVSGTFLDQEPFLTITIFEDDAD